MTPKPFIDLAVFHVVHSQFLFPYLVPIITNREDQFVGRSHSAALRKVVEKKEIRVKARGWSRDTLLVKVKSDLKHVKRLMSDNAFDI